ncbi:MAG: thioredoxin [Thiothrix sp.]|nr:MAG: thioredoxin [Thiothrix sp.]
MNNLFRHALILAISLCGLFAVSVSAASRDPGTHFFQESFGDYQEELETAKEENKKGVLIFFEMDDCPFCHRMKKTILNQPEVQDYFRSHFRIFSLDIEGDVEMTDFEGNPVSQKDFAFKQHRVRATPVIAFFDLEGRKVMSYTGAARDPAEFLLMGDFVVGEHYKKSSFTKFKREQGKSGK